MKTIFTLLFATVFTSAAFAYDEGRLTITTAVKKDVHVYVDGRLYSETDNTIVVNNIQPGNHTIKIYKKSVQATKVNGRDRKRNNAARNELVYSSTVYVRPSYHVDVVVNRFGKALVDEKALADRNGSWDDEWNEGSDDSYEDNYRPALSDHHFRQVLQKINSQWFGKMNDARDAVNSNYFTVAQMRQVLQIFTSESDRLELGKLSYKNISDRQNFRQLYDLFSYASQSELDRYTRDFRP